MRIIIEIDKDGMPVQVQTESEADEARESDGGAPEGALTGALQGEQPAGDLSQETTAGGPPDWLVQSIESAMAVELSGQGSSAEDDGGAAPD